MRCPICSSERLGSHRYCPKCGHDYASDGAHGNAAAQFGKPMIGSGAKLIAFSLLAVAVLFPLGTQFAFSGNLGFGHSVSFQFSAVEMLSWSMRVTEMPATKIEALAADMGIDLENVIGSCRVYVTLVMVYVAYWIAAVALNSRFTYRVVRNKADVQMAIAAFVRTGVMFLIPFLYQRVLYRAAPYMIVFLINAGDAPWNDPMFLPIPSENVYQGGACASLGLILTIALGAFFLSKKPYKP